VIPKNMQKNVCARLNDDFDAVAQMKRKLHAEMVLETARIGS